MYKLLVLLQDITFLFIDILKRVFSSPFYRKELIKQIDELGVSSLPVIILTGVFLGLVLTIQAALGVQKLGAISLVPTGITLSLVRELGPSLGSLMVAGRVGSGISSQLGSMKVTYQIDAMKVLGSDPLRKLVIPRFLALIIILPALILLLIFVGLVSAVMMADISLNISSVYFWNEVVRSLSFFDIFSVIIKSIIFGGIIGLLGNYYGLTAEGGTEGVGKAATKSVVIISVTVLFADFILTKIFYEIIK